MRLFSLTFVVAVAFSTAAMAAPVTYTCAIKGQRENTWIPQQLVIQHNAETGQVIVNDPVILNFVGQPVEGRVDTDNAKRVTFRWDLVQVKDRGGQFVPRFLYRATYIKATGVVSVSAQPAGYDNSFEGRGTCSLG